MSRPSAYSLFLISRRSISGQVWTGLRVFSHILNLQMNSGYLLFCLLNIVFNFFPLPKTGSREEAGRRKKRLGRIDSLSRGEHTEPFPGWQHRKWLFLVEPCVSVRVRVCVCVSVCAPVSSDPHRAGQGLLSQGRQSSQPTLREAWLAPCNSSDKVR